MVGGDKDESTSRVTAALAFSSARTRRPRPAAATLPAAPGTVNEEEERVEVVVLQVEWTSSAADGWIDPC